MIKNRISIVMPFKNAMPYLAPCITSILNQNYEQWELIAVNDHSTDDSYEYMLDMSDSDYRIKTLNNQEQGICSALQTGYAQTAGEFIHRMDADDIMPEDKLKNMIEHWKPKSVVTGMVEYFSSDWMVGLGFQNYEKWINHLMKTDSVWEDIYMECPIPSPAWLMHKNDFDAIGGFSGNKIPEDYDLCFRMYAAGIQPICISEVIHRWRDSQNRVSRKHPDYFPMSYYPMKVEHFLNIDFDRKKKLLLWGAGKKGKKIAQLLIDHQVSFIWATNNKKKTNTSIYNTLLYDIDDLNIRDNYQIILAVSSPEDKVEIQTELDNQKLVKSQDYWWFC